MNPCLGELVSHSQLLFTPSTHTVYSYYEYDGHGSVRALTDQTGTVTHTYDYDAFGNLIHSTGSTPNNYVFVGWKLPLPTCPLSRCTRPFDQGPSPS